MPEYDAFGREIGEDTLSQWKQGSSALPPSEPAPQRPATPAPAAVTAGDPLGSPAAAQAALPQAAAPRARRTPSSDPGLRRRRRRRGTKLGLLLVAGWIAFNLIGTLVDKVGDAARTISVPDLSPPAPAEQPTGLGAGSLLRPAAFQRALGDIRRRDIGRLQHLRVAPERIDATLHTPRKHARQRAGLGGRRLPALLGVEPGLPRLEHDPLRPARPARAAAPDPRRRGAPRWSGRAINYLVPSPFDGKVTWGAYFKNGAIFLADARGRITRRINWNARGARSPGPLGIALGCLRTASADAVGRLRADPLAQRGRRRRARRRRACRAARSPRRSSSRRRRAARRPRAAEHRAARVALAGVDAALGVAGADLRLGLEGVVGVRAVGVGRDRDLGLLQRVGRVAALLGGAEAGDRLERRGRPQRRLGGAGDRRRRLGRGARRASGSRCRSRRRAGSPGARSRARPGPSRPGRACWSRCRRRSAAAGRRPARRRRRRR